MGFNLNDLNPMTWTAGGVGALDLLPGVGQFKGQKSANEMNWRIAQARNEFEKEEAQLARDFSSSQATINRGFTSKEARELRNWQEQMSNTAVSRRMADMKSAGINPILAGKYDASTPAGAMGAGSQPATAKANAHGADMRAAFIDTLPIINSAIDIKAKLAQVDKTKAETKGITHGLPKKGLFGRLWDTVFQDYTRIQNYADRYQTDAKQGKGLLDKADNYLDKVIVEPLKDTLYPKGKKLKNTNGLKTHPIKGFDDEGIPIYY